MKAVIYGTGATGARIGRQLLSNNKVERLDLIEDRDEVLEEVVKSLGSPARAVELDGLRLESRLESFAEITRDADVVFLTASDDHYELAKIALASNCNVVSSADDPKIVSDLVSLDGQARQQGKAIIAGAAFSPGLTCLLAAHGAKWLDSVDEIHVVKMGTGGPACARQHHRALRRDTFDWHNRQWQKRRGGAGRELSWFPDPVGGRDCYHADVADSTLMLRAFPDLLRTSGKIAATRRDRVTKSLPMLRKPHPEGLVGAVRTEIRGWSGSIRSTIILGAIHQPAVAAAVVAGLVGEWAVRDRLAGSGAGGLAEMVTDTSSFLGELALRGVSAAKFEGTSSE